MNNAHAGDGQNLDHPRRPLRFGKQPENTPAAGTVYARLYAWKIYV